MATLLLHIGSPKTGSSAIQASLYQSASDLRAASKVVVLPPNPFRKPMPSGFISACFLPLDLLPRILAARNFSDPLQLQKDVCSYKQLLSDLLRLGKPASSTAWRASLQRYWADFRLKPTRSALLSSEYLFRMPTESILALREWFVGLGFNSFRILVYIREPVSAYKSFLQQWLRMSDDLVPYHPTEWSYDFRSSISAWESVFGADSLIVRPFDSVTLYKNSVVADFYHQASKVFQQSLSGPEPPSVNESLSAEALIVMQQLLSTVSPDRRMASDWIAIASKFLRLLRSQQDLLPCTPLELKPWVARLILRRHDEDMRWLSERFNATLHASAPYESLDETRPDASVQINLYDLIEPPVDFAIVDQLRQLQLEAIFNNGLK